MLPRTLLCRHAALPREQALTRFSFLWAPVHLCAKRWRSAVATAWTAPTGCADRGTGDLCLHHPAKRQSHKVALGEPVDLEQEIWGLIQRGDFSKAVSLSCLAHKQRREQQQPLSLLARFMLTKRKLEAECLLAGIYALTHELCLEGLQLHDYVPFMAALLADNDMGLVDMCSSLPACRRKAMDAAFAGSLALYYLQQKSWWQARLLWKHMPRKARFEIEWAALNAGHIASLVPVETARHVSGAWMLRRPTSDFVDIDSASSVVAELLRAGICPDQPVVETLLTTAIRLGKPQAASPVYATRYWPQSIPQSKLIDLVGTRASLARSAPRIHHDVLGAAVRAKDLSTALVVAAALRSRQTFHFLISLWVSHHGMDWESIVELARAMLRTLSCDLLHSTHHLVLSSLLTMAKSATCSSTLSSAIVTSALDLHWGLAPRLESPSLAGIHQLLRALVDNGMSKDAFRVYRDAQRRPKWTKFIASDAILAVLAGELARREDVRSIMHYASVATRSGIFLSAHFYTAVICGLTLPIKLIASRSSSLLTGKYRARRRGQDTFGLASSGSSTSLRRIHIAESLFDAMRENNIDAPTKAYHALMYAWALLGQPHKVQEYFDMIERAAAIAPAGISEVTWGILLYSHARAHDVHGALGVLVRAREWVFSAGRGAVTKAASRTSYLVNISVCALLVDRDASSALSLLDSCILRYDEYLQRKESRPGGWELPATPADPATRSLIVRALLDNQKLTQAMEVYDAIHAQYDIPESASELKPMLQFCLGQADVHCALQIAERVLQVGGVGALTESQWTRLFYLCIQGQKDDAFVKVLDNVSALRVGSSGTCVFEAEVAPMLKRTYPGAVEWFCRALRRGGRAGEAASIESCLATAAQTPPAKPTTSTRAILPPSHEPSNHAHCISLYRDLLRAIRTFPLAELRRKLKYNARFSFELYRDLDTNSPKIQQLIRGGRIQLEWLTSWHNDPETCQKLVHKHMAPK